MSKTVKKKTIRRHGKVTKVTTIVEEFVETPKPKAKPKAKLTNHVIFCLDTSGSMFNCYSEAVHQLNAGVKAIKDLARATGQHTTISLYTFGATVRRPWFQIPVEDVRELGQFEHYDGGSTPLRDAVCSAIDDARNQSESSDSDTAYLLKCITDGGENSSHRYPTAALEQWIRSAQATDRWTLVFMVPRGQTRTLASFGVPIGNITEWDNTVEGARQVFQADIAATNSYYNVRTAGLTSTDSYFITDLSDLTKHDLKQMKDLSASFTVFNVTKEVAIKDFVEGKGGDFVLGAGYYQVTKKELLRTGRQVLVKEKGSPKIYGGADARDILGLPAGEVRVTPGNHANYDIFFQSTSVNRRLVRGTALLWDTTKSSFAI
jgi:hypothetical protein